MATGEGRPSVVRRQLGRRLRTLRQEAGRTVEDVITAGVASRTKLWRIEGGRTTVRVGDVLVLARLYRVDPADVDELVALAEASASPGYVEEFREGLPEESGIYADLEARAAALAVYSGELVPAMLQTETYIRAVTAIDPQVSPTAVEQCVALRRKRQRTFLERSAPGRLEAVVTEGALRVQVGSSAVMQEQIAHLRAIAERDDVSVGVLPFERGLHAMVQGPFTILDFDDPDDPDLVRVETVVGAQYIEKPHHVSRLRAVFGEIRARAVPMGEYVHR